jgi:hypothetical protein
MTLKIIMSNRDLASSESDMCDWKCMQIRRHQHASVVTVGVKKLDIESTGNNITNVLRLKF